MRRTTMLISGVAIALSASGLVNAQMRDQDRQQQGQQYDQQRDGQQREQLMLLHADDEIINASITNFEQENLGTVDALVVDVHAGHVAYAVVSFGGFLGIGDTLHAVPFTALHSRPLHDDLVLDVTRSRLEQMRGFERDAMPNFADEQWGRNVHREFGVEPYWEQQMNQTGQGQQDRWGGQQRQQQQQPGQTPDEPTYPGMEQREYLTTYDLFDIRVDNAAGEEIGTIRDIVVNFETGAVEYAVLAYGGWLGMGETYTAIPLQAFEPHNLRTDDPRMVLDITRDQLREAPEHRRDRWPLKGAADWANQFVHRR